MLYLVDEIYQLKFWIYLKEQKSEFGALHGWGDLTCSLVLEIKSRYIKNFEDTMITSVWGNFSLEFLGLGFIISIIFPLTEK